MGQREAFLSLTGVMCTLYMKQQPRAFLEKDVDFAREISPTVESQQSQLPRHPGLRGWKDMQACFVALIHKCCKQCPGRLVPGPAAENCIRTEAV